MEEYLKINGDALQKKNESDEEDEDSNKNQNLLIYVLTYNIHGGMPTEDQIPLLFPRNGKLEKFDIFVINTQECLHSIGVSLFRKTVSYVIQFTRKESCSY